MVSLDCHHVAIDVVNEVTQVKIQHSEVLSECFNNAFNFLDAEMTGLPSWGRTALRPFLDASDYMMLGLNLSKYAKTGAYVISWISLKAVCYVLSQVQTMSLLLSALSGTVIFANFGLMCLRW